MTTKTKAEATAGPYRVVRSFGDPSTIRVEDWTPDGIKSVVATVATRDAAEANAHLLAASWEMREALRYGVACAQGVVDCWESGDLAGAVNLLREWAEDEAQAALAKADGKE